MEDNRSVCSGGSQGSVSLSKVECPHCKQEFQQRAIFNHIRVKHPREMITMTTRKFLEEAVKGFPLCIYWIVKNDFDEEEESKIFVCLSTNKTFKTEERANLHFNKSPADKKKHMAHAKMLLKDFQKEKKKKNEIVNPYQKKHSEMIKNNDPALAKALWRGLMFHKSRLELGLWFAEKQQLDDSYVCFSYRQMTRSYEPTTWFQMRSDCMNQIEHINILLRTKCMDCNTLKSRWFAAYLFWSKDLATSLDLCDSLKADNSLWKEEFFFYANETMPEAF